MRLVHEPTDGTSRVIASTVDLADSLLSQTRGLMFRRSIPNDYALVFRFGAARRRDVHMLFVPFSIDVVWLVDETVRQVDRLRPWLGFERADADTIVELPAGAAAEVEPDDRLVLEGGNEAEAR